jgi:hypothetical protein
MRHPRALALAGAAAVAALAACHEPPFAPRWDADMYMPLSTQPIPLVGVGPIIPAGADTTISFPPQEQSVDGVLGTLLKNLVTDPSRCTLASNPSLSCDLLTLAVRKPVGLTAQGTLYVGATQAELTNPQPSTIVFPVNVPSSSDSVTDSLYLSQPSVAMLQAAGESGTSLWIQFRGRVGNPGPGLYAVTGADSVNVTLAATIRVAVSHK